MSNAQFEYGDEETYLKCLISRLEKENETLKQEVEELRDRLKIKGEESQAV